MLLSASSLRADRPDIGLLLPEDTSLLISIPDAQRFLRAVDQTTYANLLHDKRVQPLLRRVWEIIEEPRKQFEERVGRSLSELAELPQGAISFALFSLGDPAPAAVLLVDVGDDAKGVAELLEKLELELLNAGAGFEQRQVRGSVASVFRVGDDPPREVAITLRDRTLLLTTGVVALEEVLKRWDGDREEGVLEKSSNYVETLRYSRVQGMNSTHAFAYLQPIELYRGLTVDNLAAQAAMVFIPALGLDGVRGIGGNLVFHQRPFDSVLHVHLLLDKDRRGVVKALDFGEADLVPEAWVSDDVVQYQTMHWNTKKTLAVVRDTLADFQGEGAFETFVTGRISDALGVDFERDFVSALTGDFVRLSWILEADEPTGVLEQDATAELQREAWAIAMRVKDAEQFEGVVERMAQNWGERVKREEFDEAIIYSANPVVADEGDEEGQRRERRRRRRRGPSSGAFGLIDNYLVVTDRVEAVERMIDSLESGSPLAESPIFESAVKAARGNFGGGYPISLSFTRNDLVMEFRWSLLRSELLRLQLREWFDGNEMVLQLVDALEQHPLPPWSQVSQYVAPSISVIGDNETGVHYTLFRLKPQEVAEDRED
jgi:hypothetical protein